MKAVPANQQVKDSHGEGQTSLEVRPNAVHDLLEMANGGEHRQYSFNHHAFVVVERLTHLQIGRITLFRVEAMIGKDDRSIFKRAMKG